MGGSRGGGVRKKYIKKYQNEIQADFFILKGPYRAHKMIKHVWK